MTKTKFVPTNIDPTQFPSDSLFICDASLGRIAKHLRMLGVDVLYDKNSTASHVLFLARKTKRILITRNRGMVNGMINNEHERKQKKLRKQMRKEGATILQQAQSGAAVELDEQQKLVQEWLLRKEEEKRKQMEKLKQEKEEILRWKKEEAAAKKSVYSNEEEEEDDEAEEEEDDDEEVFEEEWEELDDDDDDNIEPVKYYFVRERQFADQITNLVNFFKIRYTEDKLFSRCLVCNNKINQIPNKEEVKHLVFSSVYQEHDKFYRCQGCKKIYWGKDSEKEHVNFRTAREFALQHSYKGEVNGSKNTEESIAEPSKTESTVGITTEA